MGRRLALAAVVSTILALPAAASAATRTVTASSNGHTIRLGLGDTLTVRLPQSKDGGFSWETLTAPDAHVLTTLSTFYVPPKLAPGAVGGVGTRVYRYRAHDVGTARISLGETQAGSPAIVKRFRLKVECFRLAGTL